MALVEISNVTKHYHKGGQTIKPLDGVSLDIEQGEFISLMGASGTGKSTLLNVVASIDRPDAGTITIDGTEITTMSRTRLAAVAGCQHRLHFSDPQPDSRTDGLRKRRNAACCCYP